MQSIDLNSRLTGRRRRIQKSLEWSCYGAVTVTAILMLLFFSTLGYRGIGAFTQTKIDVVVTEVHSTTKKTINNSMYNLFNNPDRKTKKDLRHATKLRLKLEGDEPFTIDACANAVRGIV